MRGPERLLSQPRALAQSASRVCRSAGPVRAGLRPSGVACACDGEETCECFCRDLVAPKAALFNTRHWAARAAKDPGGRIHWRVPGRHHHQGPQRHGRHAGRPHGGHELCGWGPLGGRHRLWPGRGRQPTRSFSYHIDARMLGNETRFINHHCDPDTVNCDYFRERHKGRMYVAIKATRDIHRGQELLLDYGSMDDWAPADGGFRRCGSREKCRYQERRRLEVSRTYRVQISGLDGSNPKRAKIEPDGAVRPCRARPAVTGPVVATKPYHTTFTKREETGWLLRAVRVAASRLGFRAGGLGDAVVRAVHRAPPSSANSAGQLAGVTPSRMITMERSPSY